MKNNLQTHLFSSSAKKIKKEISQFKPESISYQQIVQILEEKSRKVYDNSAYQPDYSLLRSEKIESEIRTKVYKISGVSISSVYFLKVDVNKRLKVFREANVSYTLAQYLQNYDILTNKKVFKDHITTYREAIENAKNFATELFLKYKNVEEHTFRKYKSGNCHSDEIKDLEELYIIVKKREEGYHLSSCDEVLEFIINRIFEQRDFNKETLETHDEYFINEISQKIKKEFIRVKVLSETRIGYSDLVEDIAPYHFHIKTDQEKEMVETLMNENKKHLNSERGIYFGSNKDKSNKLTSNLDKLDFLGKEHVVLKKNKKILGFNKALKNNKKEINFPFFKYDSPFSLTNKELEDGLYISATIGSGFSEALRTYFVQTFYNNECNILFDTYGDHRLRSDLQISNRIANNNSGITVITHVQFLSLTKEKLLSLLKKEKSIIFSLNAIELSDKETVDKYITKIRFALKIIGMYKKNKYYNVFINDSNQLFNRKNPLGEKFSDDFHSMKRSFKKTKLFIKGTGSIDRELFKDFKYKLLMKTECNLNFDIFETKSFESKGNNFENYDSQKVFNKNIMDLNCGEFVFVIDNKVSLENEIYKIPYLNFHNLDIYDENQVNHNNYYINYDLND